MGLEQSPPAFLPNRAFLNIFREYVVNANDPVLRLQEQDIVKYSPYFTRSPRPADKSKSQFALSTYSRHFFP
jgi:hypothetical protein